MPALGGVALARAPKGSYGKSAELISVGLRSLSQKHTGQVTLGDLADATGAGGTALLLFLFASASFVPGVAPAFGLAICFVSISLMRGTHVVPLPGLLRRRRILRERLARVLERGLPRLEPVEARLKPRLPWLTRRVALCFVGIACFVSGLLIVLPVPFGNTAPAAAVLLLALGMGAADGLLILSGLAAFVLALAFDIGMVILSWDLFVAVITAVF